MFTSLLENVVQTRPLVHCITNYVSANDCANLLLALGASPIMADAPSEVEEITGHAKALVLNMGTLSETKLTSMLLAGQKANQLGIPVILDPVGVGASHFRKQAAHQLLSTIHFSVIRGNASEIETLLTDKSISIGIDVASPKTVTPYTIQGILQLATALSYKTRSIIAVSGKTDLVTNGYMTYAVFNGHSDLTRITGTGCMLTSLIGAYCGANPSQLLEATVAAVGTVGISSEFAHQKCELLQGGTGTFRTLLLDAVSLITPIQLQGGLHYEIYT